MALDVAAAMAKRGFRELTDDDLCHKGIEAVKCRSCSGYGNCGYKTFRLYKGEPFSVCNLRLQKVQQGEGLDDEDGAGGATGVAADAGAGAVDSAEQ